MALIEHLEKLRHFHKLTNYRSINEGAQSMGLSQAGLSKSIASLESVLEVSLFVRSRQGLVLTKEGELLLKSTKKILAEANQTEARLRSLKAADLPEKVRIGMYDSIAVYFFPTLISYVKTIYPSVEIELIVDRSENLANLIAKEKIDLAVGVNLANRKKINSEFFLLFDDFYSFYVSPKAEKTTNDSIIFNPDATDENGLTNEKYLIPLLKKHKAHRAYNFETIKTLISLGLGIGVLPTQVAKPLIQNGELISTSLEQTPHFFGRHSIGFLAAKDFLKDHQEFAEDVYRLGERWAKM